MRLTRACASMLTSACAHVDDLFAHFFNWVDNHSHKKIQFRKNVFFPFFARELCCWSGGRFVLFSPLYCCSGLAVGRQKQKNIFVLLRSMSFVFWDDYKNVPVTTLPMTFFWSSGALWPAGLWTPVTPGCIAHADRSQGYGSKKLHPKVRIRLTNFTNKRTHIIMNECWVWTVDDEAEGQPLPSFGVSSIKGTPLWGSCSR